MALESYCASCTYLGETVDYNGKYWCSRKGQSMYACDPKCYNWCEAYGRSTYARENMYENSRSHTSSGCYLTTVMCNILGYADDNYYLQTLRTFRDTILKQDIKYYPLLVTYDVIGPAIALHLSQDENREQIAKTMFNNYISKAVTAIEENKVNEATNIYVAMTNVLAEKYNINTKIITINPEDIDINTLGHGRTRKKVYQKPTINIVEA